MTFHQLPKEPLWQKRSLLNRPIGQELELTIHGMMARILLRAYWAEHAVVWGDPRYGLAVYPALLSIALARAGNPGEEGVRAGAGSG